MEIIFKRSQAKIKKPKHLKKNVFVVYSPRTVKIEPATSTKIDTEIIVLLPKDSQGFITSIFRENKINEFSSNQQRLRVEILNKSYKETLKLKNNNPLGFIVIEPEHLKSKHEMTEKKTPYYRKRRNTNRKRKRQCGFLNRYDFAYAGRDTVNQAAKVAPGVIKAATNDVNNIAEQRIN